MLLRLLLAFILPPLSVFLGTGISQAFFINLVLTFIGWIPGIIHALWIISKESEEAEV
jgi:uncharacterized membrane protein YqaE (UPF0057 family)